MQDAAAETLRFLKLGTLGYRDHKGILGGGEVPIRLCAKTCYVEIPFSQKEKPCKTLGPEAFG